jgi:signal transduction histidine kinase
MKSIRAKLWVGMMILVGVIIVLLWLFQIVFLDKFYTVIEIGEVRKNAENIVAEIEELTDITQINNEESIPQNIENYIYEKQLSVEVIDYDYNVLYQGTSGSNTNMPGVMKEAFLEVSKSAMEGEESKQVVTHPKYGYDFMIIGIPIRNETSVQGVMMVTMPLASVGDTVDILKRQLIIITCVLFVVSLLISYKLSKNFANPISKISRQADSYAKGEYHIRINPISDDEIGKLAKRMNDMGEALARNDVLQKELIANVSHELRTPLTLIRGYAETLRDVTGENQEKREKQLGIIIEESERLGNIVEDILNLSRLQAGAKTLEMEKFSLKEMLTSIKEHFELGEKDKSLDLVGVLELDENLLGDKNKIQQVFYNLIGNAFRHSRSNQSVVVVAISNEKTVRIEVRDQGEGIAEEDIAHVFERYYKGKRSDGKKGDGTGLGLAIVKSILDMHHVPYGVESKLGAGTIFWFELKKENSHTSF